MTKIKFTKANAGMKKRLAMVRRQMNKRPRKLAKEAAESVKAKFRYERNAEQERHELLQAGKDFFFEDISAITHDTRKRYSIRELARLYIVSLANREPHLEVTDLQQKQYTCQCTDKRTKSVTLYMMCAHVERTLRYCGSKPLVNVLFQMQFLPSDGKTPNVAIHFAMLKYLHSLKMIEQMSTHGFTHVTNDANEEGKPLQKDILNNVYLLYRRIINHSTDSMAKMFNLSQANCYSCDGAHVLKSIKLHIMYDIVCRCKKRLEDEFPTIKGNSLYAVPVFHAYAHSANCQAKFNPRYITGFDNKDGESCERLWSYLNRFVCLIRSMTATNRRLIILDAVNHYRATKMLSLPSLLKEKYKNNKKIISDCEGKTEGIYQTLEDEWNTTKKNMTMSSAERVGEAFCQQFLALDKKYFYYIDVAKYPSIPANSTHSLLISVKTRLKTILETKYDDLNEVCPQHLEDSIFDAIRDIVNEETAFVTGLLLELSSPK